MAAGKGTRMKSQLPKVLHKLGGRSLLQHVLDAASVLGAARTIVITGHGAEVVEAAIASAGDGQSSSRPNVILILADDHTVLISSANLTGRALDNNMEAGVLISGGPIPQTLYQHFRQLSYDGIIQKD